MSDLPKINSRESLEAWLEGRPHEDAAIIAHRAAMRVAPLWMSTMRDEWVSEAEIVWPRILRCLLVSGVVGKYQTRELRTVAERVYQEEQHYPMAAAGVVMATLGAAYDAARTASVFDSFSAALAVTSAADGASEIELEAAIWSSTQIDARGLIHGDDMSGLPLWQDDNPLAEIWQKSRSVLREDTPGGEFWIDWYQRALDGRPQNWPLLRDVALIDDAVWNEGGAALDARIRELRQEHAIAATANGERVEVSPETGRLRLVPVTELPDDLAHYVRRKIIKAVEVFDGDAGQSWRALAPDLAMLRRAVEDAGNLPVELFDACSSAVRRLARRAKNGECPAPEQDALIADYRDRLRDAGADILANDPETQRVLERRATIAGNDALIEASGRISEAVEVMRPLLEGRLADALPADAATATDPAAAPEERSAASFRFSGRFLRIHAAIGTAREVGKGFALGACGAIWAADYLRALEYLASREPRRLLDAIFRFLGL